MDAVKKAFHQDITQAFTEVLRIWLRHRYNVKKYGLPTWHRLIEAVDNPAGGNNHALAKIIAEHHPVKQLIDSMICHACVGGNTPTLAKMSADSEYHPSTMAMDGSTGRNNHSLPKASTKYCPSATDCEQNPCTTPAVDKTIAEHHPTKAVDGPVNIRGNNHALLQISERHPYENPPDHKTLSKHPQQGIMQAP